MAEGFGPAAIRQWLRRAWSAGSLWQPEATAETSPAHYACLAADFDATQP